MPPSFSAGAYGCIRVVLLQLIQRQYYSDLVLNYFSVLFVILPFRTTVISYSCLKHQRFCPDVYSGASPFESRPRHILVWSRFGFSKP